MTSPKYLAKRWHHNEGANLCGPSRAIGIGFQILHRTTTSNYDGDIVPRIIDDRDLYGGLIRLHVLHHAGEKPLYGHWMIEELRRHGYEIGPGTMYPLLHSLARKGYLESKQERSGSRYLPDHANRSTCFEFGKAESAGIVRRDVFAPLEFLMELHMSVSIISRRHFLTGAGALAGCASPKLYAHAESMTWGSDLLSDCDFERASCAYGRNRKSIRRIQQQVCNKVYLLSRLIKNPLCPLTFTLLSDWSEITWPEPIPTGLAVAVPES